MYLNWLLFLVYLQVIIETVEVILEMVLKEHNNTIGLNLYKVPPFAYDNININLEDAQMKFTN